MASTAGLGAALLTNGDIVRQARAVERGETTTTRPEIGRLLRYISAQPTSVCTATLVLPHFVLTAAHCIFYSSEHPEQYFFGVDSADGFIRYQVAEIFNFGPSLQWGDVVPSELALMDVPLSPTPSHRGSNDVALLRLETSVPPDVATPSGVATWYLDPGVTVTVFGYGYGRCHGTIETGLGVRRHSSWTYQVNDLSPENTQYISPTGLICSGDSGGPAVLGRPEERGPIWGVASTSSSSFDTYGDVIYFRPLMERIVTGTPVPEFSKERGDPEEWLQATPMTPILLRPNFR